MVGLAGLEPATFRPPDGRATRLRYSPTAALITDLALEGKDEYHAMANNACAQAARLIIGFP